MRKKKCWILLIVFLLVIIKYQVYADETCETSELSRLRKLAEKVDINYDYEFKELTTPGGKVNKYVDYSLTAINLNPDLQVALVDNYYENKFIEFKGDANGKATLKSFIEGDKIKVSIYAYVSNGCSGKLITTKTINLPYYNRFHDSEACKIVTDYNYCLKFYDEEYCGKISDMTFCDEFINSPLNQTQFNSKINKLVNSYYYYYDDLSGLKRNKIVYYIIIFLIIVVGAFVGLEFVTSKRKKKFLQKGKLKVHEK